MKKKSKKKDPLLSPPKGKKPKVTTDVITTPEGKAEYVVDYILRMVTNRGQFEDGQLILAPLSTPEGDVIDVRKKMVRLVTKVIRCETLTTTLKDYR